MNIEEKLKKRLLGQEIDRLAKGVDGERTILRLKNGTELELYESAQDCCAVAHGTWETLADNAHGGITDVQFEAHTDEGDNDYDAPSTDCLITLLHENTTLAKASGYATSGNGGFYFSVLSLRVKVKGETIDDFDVISA